MKPQKQEENKKRILEIEYQWQAYKNNPRAYGVEDLKILKAEAKKMGVRLK